MNSKKNDETKTALKLLNKFLLIYFRYAESHNRLEEENKTIKQELKDLKSTLQINKEIIRGLVSTQNESEQNLIYLTKLKEEIVNLTLNNEKLKREKDEYYSRLSYIEQVHIESNSLEKNDAEKLKSKIFYLEQLITKKDNMLSMSKQKQEKGILNSNSTIHSSVFNPSNSNEREIYVKYNLFKIIDPNTAVNLLHDELEMYKNVSQGFNESIKEYALKIQKYETIIQVNCIFNLRSSIMNWLNKEKN